MQDGVVEGALERGIRGRRQQVYERCSKPAEVPYQPLALFDGAGVAASDGESRPPVQVLGDDRQRGDGAEPDDGAELVGRFGDEVPVEAQDVGGIVGRPEDGSGHHSRADRVQRELERGDDTEISAAAAKRPEQVGMFVGGRPDDAALGGDHLGGQQVVDGEPVLAHEKADARTEREPGNAGVAHDAASGGQTVGLRLVVDIAPQRTALHQCRAADRVDPHGPHRRQVDDDAVVAYSGTGHIVTTAADGDLQVVVSGETHGHQPRRRPRCIERSAGGAGRPRRSRRLGRCRSRGRQR